MNPQQLKHTVHTLSTKRKKCLSLVYDSNPCHLEYGEANEINSPSFITRSTIFIPVQ